MAENPYLSASKYETARRREVKRHREAVDRERSNHVARLLALRQALSPAAARIVVAAEGELDPVVLGVDHGEQPGEVEPDPNPAPAWLNGEPPPLAPGSLIEVADKPRRAAR